LKARKVEKRKPKPISQLNLPGAIIILVMKVLEPSVDNSRELLTELTVEYEALKDDYTLQVIFIMAI
jgi:hypothetical protein